MVHLLCACNEVYSKYTVYRYLFKKLRILHCDISINNLLISRPDAMSKAVGLLINFNFACLVDESDANVLPAGETYASSFENISLCLATHESSGTGSSIGDFRSIDGFGSINEDIAVTNEDIEEPTNDNAEESKDRQVCTVSSFFSHYKANS